MDHQKINAELDVLREFIDFVNRQVGVYCDCLSGFQGNKVRVERQMPRLLRPTSRSIVDGQPVITHVSVEDPGSPDVLIQRTIRAEEFNNVNSEAGYNEQQVCWAIIVFIFATWDEEIRPRIAHIRGVEPNTILLDEMGDLRTLRRAIIHNGGIVAASEHAKLTAMADLCRSDAKLALTHDQMHTVFVHVKRSISRLMIGHFSHLPGAPDPASIVDVGISSHR